MLLDHLAGWDTGRAYWLVVCPLVWSRQINRWTDHTAVYHLPCVLDQHFVAERVAYMLGNPYHSSKSFLGAWERLRWIKEIYLLIELIHEKSGYIWRVPCAKLEWCSPSFGTQRCPVPHVTGVLERKHPQVIRCPCAVKEDNDLPF